MAQRRLWAHRSVAAVSLFALLLSSPPTAWRSPHRLAGVRSRSPPFRSPTTRSSIYSASGSRSRPARPGDALGVLFRFGLVSTAVQVMAGWIAMRGRVVLRDRLAAANA